MSLPGDVPVELGREAARALAEAELSDPAYRAAEPSLPTRAFRWVLERLEDLIGGASAAAPGGGWGLLAMTGLLVVAAVVVARLAGTPLALPTRSEHRVVAAEGAVRSAQEHRALADAAQATGDLRTAVVERFRAVVRELVEQDLVAERAASTADETALAAGTALPVLAERLAAGARDFDGVQYGDHPPRPDTITRLRALDDDVRRSR